MQLGRQPKVPFPESYKGVDLVRTHGRVFCLPPGLDPKHALASNELFRDPGVRSAATLDEARELIDRLEDAPTRYEPADRLAGCSAIRSQGVVHGTATGEPAEAGVPVEFAGWLPIFEFSGNCGSHPQFTHAAAPPPGYRFTRSAPPKTEKRVGPSLWERTGGRFFTLVAKAVSAAAALARVPVAFFKPVRGVTIRARVRVFVAMMRLMVLLLRRGCRPAAVLRFLQSRHLQSQLLVGDRRDLVFLTSMPYTFGQNPWVIEIEDPTTLFYPLIQNGHTCDLSLAESPYFPVIKALLEADHCRGIVTHIRSTAELVSRLFDSDVIRRKIVYTPLGVRLPARWQRHDPAPDAEPIHLLFINSWCQVPENFYVRGGLDVLEAFARLRVKYPQLRLTMRTALPHLAAHYYQLMEAGWVRVINRFLTAEEMAELHAGSHVFLLPAARVHIVSLLQAMSYGMAVVGSDGWGMEEYLKDGRNGLVVRGRYGKTSWADTDAGMLRENYEPTYLPDPLVVEGIVEAVSRLVEDRMLRRRLGQTAREDVRTRFNMDQWNDGLAAAFDQARGGQRTTPGQHGGSDSLVPCPASPSGSTI